jgi:hypothetical protein
MQCAFCASLESAVSLWLFYNPCKSIIARWVCLSFRIILLRGKFRMDFLLIQSPFAAHPTRLRDLEIINILMVPPHCKNKEKVVWPGLCTWITTYISVKIIHSIHGVHTPSPLLRLNCSVAHFFSFQNIGLSPAGQWCNFRSRLLIEDPIRWDISSRSLSI